MMFQDLGARERGCVIRVTLKSAEGDPLWFYLIIWSSSMFLYSETFLEQWLFTAIMLSV
jgi:hypothetical protein